MSPDLLYSPESYVGATSTVVSNPEFGELEILKDLGSPGELNNLPRLGSSYRNSFTKFSSPSLLPPVVSHQPSPLSSVHTSPTKAGSAGMAKWNSPPVTPMNQFIPSPDIGAPPPGPRSLSEKDGHDSCGLFTTQTPTQLVIGDVGITLTAFYNEQAFYQGGPNVLIPCRLKVQVPNYVFPPLPWKNPLIPDNTLRHKGPGIVAGQVVEISVVGNVLHIQKGAIEMYAIDLTRDVKDLIQQTTTKTITLHFSHQNIPPLDIQLLYQMDMQMWLQVLLNPFVALPQENGTSGLYNECGSLTLGSPFALHSQRHKALSTILLLPHPDRGTMTPEDLREAVSAVLSHLGLFDCLAVLFYGGKRFNSTGFHRFGSPIWEDGVWMETLLSNASDCNTLLDKTEQIAFATEMIRIDRARHSQSTDRVYSMTILSDSATDGNPASPLSPLRVDLCCSFYCIEINGIQVDRNMRHLAMQSNGGCMSAQRFDLALKALVAFTESERRCVETDLAIGIRLKPDVVLRSFSLRRGDYQDFDVDSSRPVGNRVICPLGHVREGETYCLDLQLEMAVTANGAICLTPLEAFLSSGGQSHTQAAAKWSDPVQVMTIIDTNSAGDFIQ